MHETSAELKMEQMENPAFSSSQKHTVHMWTQETTNLYCPYTRWGRYTAKKWTNYSEWHWKADCVIRFQFKLVLSFQRRTKIKLWQWCVLTSPKRNLCLSVCAHLCVRVSLRVCTYERVCMWFLHLVVSHSALGVPADFLSPCQLPLICASTLFLNPSLPALHLSLLSQENTLNSTKTPTFQELEKEGAWCVWDFFDILHEA